jgi:hypothetical protein
MFRALVLVGGISAMAACAGSAAANAPSPNAKVLARVAELSAVAHYAEAHGLIGGSPELLHPAP